MKEVLQIIGWIILVLVIGFGLSAWFMTFETSSEGYQQLRIAIENSESEDVKAMYRTYMEDDVISEWEQIKIVRKAEKEKLKGLTQQ